MDAQLTTLFVLTFAINLIGTLAYAARIAGVRTHRIALAFSLFNALVLISRTANSFQAPLLAKRVERNVPAGTTAGTLEDFRWLLLAASLATIVGAFLTQRNGYSAAVSTG
jgi:Alternate to MurJ